MDKRRSRPLTRFGWTALCSLLLIGLVAWLLRSDTTDSAPPLAVHASIQEPATGTASAEPLDALDAVAAAGRSAIDDPAPELEAAPVTPPAAIVEASEKPDLEARDWLALRVVDERSAPIFDAEVTIRGLRKQGNEGSWYGMRGGETKARTDRDGRARVDFTRWVDIDGKTVRVDLVVTHPDFIPFSETSYLLAPGEQTIQLGQGAMVWLSAWHGSPDRVVPELKISVEWSARLGQDGWTRERDGRWSTLRLAPGAHWVTVRHESAELGALASDFTPFELGEHARLDLALELKPLVALHGRLDDSIPRPIVNGHVQVNLHASDGEIGLYSDHEATVAADGSFTLEGLRTASGQIIAACDGWVSKLVPPRTLEQTRVRLPENASETQRIEALARARESDRIAQPIDAAAGETVVVEMEPTGVLEVRVVDEQGAPLVGASVSASPNVFWHGVGSRIFPWQDWQAVTDGNGVARIAHLPPDDNLWFSARTDKHQMRKQERENYPSAVIVSGQDTRVELVLELIP